MLEEDPGSHTTTSMRDLTVAEVAHETRRAASTPCSARAPSVPRDSTEVLASPRDNEGVRCEGSSHLAKHSGFCRSTGSS